MGVDAKSPQSIATFKEQLAASLDALEGMTTKLTQKDEEKLGRFRKNMAPIMEKADRILTEIEAFQKEWGPFLDRITSLDLEKLRSFTGYNKLGNPVERATGIKHSLPLVKQHLVSLKNRIAAMTAKELANFSPAEAQQDVEAFGHEIQRALDKIEGIQKAMSAFEAAQHR